MPNSIAHTRDPNLSAAHTLGQDLSAAAAARHSDEMAEALTHVKRDLKAAAELVHSESNDVLSKASKALSHAAEVLLSEVEAGGRAVADDTPRALKQHPIAAAAAIATAAAALTGLILAMNHPKAS